MRISGMTSGQYFAPGLKTIDDATYIRRRILLAFERAENETDAEERRRLTTFVVIGGGRPALKWPAPSPNLQSGLWPLISARSIHSAPASFSSRPRNAYLPRSIPCYPIRPLFRSNSSALKYAWEHLSPTAAVKACAWATNSFRPGQLSGPLA